MSERDWEQEYKKLKHQHDTVLMPLLLSALKYVPEEEDEPDYVHSIAPVNADLPVVMTMATPAEREQLIAKAKSKIINGEWTGQAIKLRDGKKIPVTAMITERQRIMIATNRRKQGNAVNFRVVHLMLIADGKYPTEERNVCSHLCHKNDCVNASHLCWSSSNDNNRRERKCRKVGHCNCGLYPPCMFDTHK